MDTSQTYPTAYPPPSYAMTESVITTMIDEQSATFPQGSAYVCQSTTSTGAVWNELMYLKYE